MKIHTVIVDDDPEDIEDLKGKIEKCIKKHQLIIVKECSNYNSGFLEVIKNEPDLIFLDIKLDDNKSGIDLIKKIYTEMPGIKWKIILMSHYSEYGPGIINDPSIKNRIYAYLLKPINEIDLIYAINVWGDNDDNKTNLIINKTNYSCNKILYLKGKRDDTEIYLTSGQVIIDRSKNIGAYEHIFIQNDDFKRISKNYIVNINYLKSNLIWDKSKRQHFVELFSLTERFYVGEIYFKALKEFITNNRGNDK
jgi:DNA-binding LytR/AlgR family response regulator